MTAAFIGPWAAFPPAFVEGAPADLPPVPAAPALLRGYSGVNPP